MNSAETLLASVVENDFTVHRIREELQAHDFETLGRCPVDFDRESDFVSADSCVEDTNVQRRSFDTRTRMKDEAGIRVKGVTREPISSGVPILFRGRWDIENSGRENQCAFDRASRPRDLDLDVVGSSGLSLRAGALEKHETCRRSGRETTPRPFIALGEKTSALTPPIEIPFRSMNYVQGIPFVAPARVLESPSWSGRHRPGRSLRYSRVHSGDGNGR